MAWHRRILSDDAVKTEYYCSNPDTGKIVLETKWKDVERIAKDCKGLYNQTSRHEPWGDWAHVASIPLCIIEAEQRKTGKNALQDKDFLRYLCNRDDLKHFRVRPGRI